MEKDPDQNIVKHATDAMRHSLRSTKWWRFVQSDVKDAVDKIISNLEVLGPIFQEAYIGLCKFEHACRVIENVAGDEEEGTLLFGAKMSEEAYQCGIYATRILLKLDDWVSPNEADVQACKYVCEVVNMLDGVFRLGKENLDVPPQARQILQKMIRESNKRPNFDLTDIPFEFDDPESP